MRIPRIALLVLVLLTDANTADRLHAQPAAQSGARPGIRRLTIGQVADTRRVISSRDSVRAFLRCESLHPAAYARYGRGPLWEEVDGRGNRLVRWKIAAFFTIDSMGALLPICFQVGRERLMDSDRKDDPARFLLWLNHARMAQGPLYFPNVRRFRAPAYPGMMINGYFDLVATSKDQAEGRAQFVRARMPRPHCTYLWRADPAADDESNYRSVLAEPQPLAGPCSDTRRRRQ
jgi:hypothetical protein